MGGSTSLFIGVLIVLLIFNFYYYTANPDETWDLVLGSIGTLFVSVCTVGLISGINIFGSGLSGSSVKILFGSVLLFFVFFTVPLGLTDINIGLGLGQTVLTIFLEWDFFGVGFMIGMGLIMLGFISGLMTIAGGGGD